MAARLHSTLENRPKQVGVSDPQIGSALRTVLLGAFEEMNRLKDEYVSTEHLLLALCAKPEGEAGRLLQQAGVTPDRVYATLEAVRGSQRVTDANPGSQVPGAREVRARPDRGRASGQAGPGDRSRRRDSPSDPGAFAQDQEQPRAHR